MQNLIQHIQTLSKVRIQHFAQGGDDRYQGPITYFEALHKEIDEAQAENKEHNSVYLEDELGDIFRDYMMLLHSLEQEGKISSIEKVFARCWQKFSGRIGTNGADAGNWTDIKAQQKAALQEENAALHDHLP